MKHSLHSKPGLAMSMSSIHVAQFSSALLHWDSGGELSSKALGNFNFYGMNELFYASGIVLTMYYLWKNWKQ